MSDNSPYLPADLTTTDTSPTTFSDFVNPVPPTPRVTPTPPSPTSSSSSSLSSSTLPLPHLSRSRTVPGSSHYSAQATAAFLDFILIEQSTSTNPHNLPLADAPTSRSRSPSFKSAKSSASKSPSRRSSADAQEFTDIELNDLSNAPRPAPPAPMENENVNGFVVVDLNDAQRFAPSPADVERWVALFGYSSGVAAVRIEEARRRAAEREGDAETLAVREAGWQAARGTMEGRGYDREAFEHLVELDRRRERVGMEEERERGMGRGRGRAIWGMVRGYWRWR